MSANKSTGTVPTTQEPKTPAVAEERIYPISGSKNYNFTNTLANQVVNTIWAAHSDKKTKDMQVAATIAAMEAIKPQDELEGMLSAQMIALHHASMECFRRAMLPEQSTEARGMNLNQATKATRTYAALLETLNRYRGKGVSEQKVTVQHVHVSEGGQAIVGNVER